MPAPGDEGCAPFFFPLLGGQAAEARLSQDLQAPGTLGPPFPILSLEPREPGGLEPGAVAGLSELRALCNCAPPNPSPLSHRGSLPSSPRLSTQWT